MQDKIVNCKHCGSPFCYEKENKDFISWSCINCGYSTNNYMKNESEQVLSFEESLPELYKDIRFIDDNNNVWYPLTINNPLKGIIFPNGTCKEDWEWSFAPAIEIPYTERFKYPDPSKKDEFMTHKIDMNKVKNFKRNEFRKALEEAGLI